MIRHTLGSFVARSSHAGDFVLEGGILLASTRVCDQGPNWRFPGKRRAPRRVRPDSTDLRRTNYCGGMAGGGYTPRRIHGSQLMPNSTSSLAS